MYKFLALLSFFSIPLFAEMTKSNDIDIWYETFGDKNDPALLLVMGGCSQGVLWPIELCQQFVDNGFYVIRYDNRDTGFSTCFDYQKEPYDLLDMAKDAAGLLDSLGIGKAHVLGFSMGGSISELLSVHFPEHVFTLTLISTSCDFRPLNLAIAGLPPEEGALPPPRMSFLVTTHEFLKFSPQTFEEKLEQRIALWNLYNGSKVPLDENSTREIHRQYLLRLQSESAVGNHFPAIQRSEELVRSVPAQVRVPTLVIHGTEDPILHPEHGAALAASIPGSKYILLEGMGHVPNSHFFDLIVEEVTTLAHP